MGNTCAFTSNNSKIRYMYPIPKDIQLNKFEGLIVQQICFTINTIDVFFGNKNSIQISGGFAIKRRCEEFTRFELYPTSCDMGFLRLLEKKVLAIYPHGNNLMIEFEDDYSLELINNEQYESFEIYIEGTRTII
jgi:hypothetical protein